jgi:hypothetical protein
VFCFLALDEEIELNLGGRVVSSDVNTAQIWRKIGVAPLTYWTFVFQRCTALKLRYGDGVKKEVIDVRQKRNTQWKIKKLSIKTNGSLIR